MHDGWLDRLLDMALSTAISRCCACKLVALGLARWCSHMPALLGDCMLQLAALIAPTAAAIVAGVTE